MSSASIGERHPHLSAAADGALLTAAAFAFAVSIQGLLMRLGIADVAGTSLAMGAAAVIGGVMVILGNVLTLLGPAIAWVMRGHKMSWRTIGTVAGGMLGGVIGVGILAVGGPLLGMAMQLFASNEMLGLIIVLVIGGVLFIAAAAFALTDAIQDIRQGDRTHRRLDIARIVSAAVALVCVIGFAVAMRLGAPTDLSEAFAFALLAAMFGAIATSLADAIDVMLDRRATHRQGMASA